MRSIDRASALLLLPFLLAPGDVATAQPIADSLVVLPEDPLVDPDRLVPHRVTWRVVQLDPDGGETVQGLWTDTWARSTEDGRPVFLFRQLFVDTEGAVQVATETVFDAATLRGIRSAQVFPPGGTRVTYRYEGDTASGTLVSSTGSEPREFRIEFDPPVWEPLTPVSVVSPLERLGKGASLRYPIFDQTPSGEAVTWREIRVDSLGSATIDGRAVEARYLTATTLVVPNTVMRLRQTLDPPYFLWFQVERPGQTREWRLVDWEPFVR